MAASATCTGGGHLLLVASAAYIVSSTGCLLAPTIGWLIALRALQGVSAAIMWPSIMGLGANMVTADRRGFTLGLIFAGVTSGNVIGPLIAGVVVWLGDWRLFFLFNVILAILVVPLVLRFLPKEPPQNARKGIDPIGIVVLAVGLGALLYALDVGADWGWLSPPILGLFAVSIALLIAFPLVEDRVRNAMVPPPLLRNREFLLTLSTNGFLVPAIFIAFLYFPQYFQKVMGWSVLQASFGALPLFGLLAVGSVVSGRFYDPVGPKRLLLIGYALIIVACISVIALNPSWGYFALVPAMLLIGFGASIAVTTAGTAAVSAVVPERASVAGGLTFTVHLGCGALGVAAATAIMYAVSGSTSTAALDAAAFTGGMSRAYWLALVAAAIGVAAILAIDEGKLKRAVG